MAERIILGRDNTIDLILKADGTALTAEQMQAITRMTVTIGAVTIDSDVEGEGAGQPFDWTTREDEGVVILAFGDNEGLSASENRQSAKLVVYDAVNDDGIEWDTFSVLVSDG